MTKVNGNSSPKVTDIPTGQAAYTFYRPHARVITPNEVVDEGTGEVSSPPSMTKQSFLAECDINNIMKQFQKTGMLSHVSAKAQSGIYADLPDEVDFQTAMNTVMAGEDAFASLPSKLRTRFGNDPAEFLAFVSDPANAEELVELGLATKPAPPPPTFPSPPPPGPENKPPDPKTGVQG